MANEIAKLFVVIGADIAGFSKGMKGVNKQLNSVANNMTSIGKQMSLAITAPIVGMSTLAFKAAGDFDQAWRKVNVMLGVSSEEAVKYKKRILEISNATGKSASDVVNAYYQIVSAGYRGADSLDILDIAMRGATGGAAEAITTTAALTKAMNIFKLEGVEGSSRAMDTFFGIVDSGLLSFEEMAQNFPQAAAMAAGLGLDIEEVGAALATLTKVSGSTAEASTALNATFAQLVTPSEALQKLYEEWGVRTGPEAIMKFGGLAGVLREVQTATEGEVDKLSELFPNTRAIRAILPLVTTNSEDFASALDTVTNATGRTNEAFEQMAQGPGFQWQQMMNTLRNAAISLGESIATTLGPWIQKVINMVQRAVDWFNNLSPTMKRVIIVVAGLAAAIGPLLLITGSLIKAFLTVRATMLGINTAMRAGIAAMTAHKTATIAGTTATKGATVAQIGLNKAMLANPIFAIIAGITALVAAIVYMWRNWERVSLDMEHAWLNVKNAVVKGVDGIMGVWEKMTSKLPGLQSFFTKVREGIRGMIDANDVKLKKLEVERAWQNLQKTVKDNADQMASDIEMAYSQMKSDAKMTAQTQISEAEMAAEQVIAEAKRVRDEEKRVIDDRIEFYRDLTEDRLQQLDKQMVAELAAMNPDLGKKAQAYLDLLDEQEEADKKRTRQIEEDKVAELQAELDKNEEISDARRRWIKDQITDYEAGWEKEAAFNKLYKDIMAGYDEEYFTGLKAVADESAANKISIAEKELEEQKSVIEAGLETQLTAYDTDLAAFQDLNKDKLHELQNYVTEYNRILEEAGLASSVKGLEVPEGPVPTERKRPSNPLEFFQMIGRKFHGGGTLPEDVLMLGKSTGTMYEALAGEEIVARGGGVGGDTYHSDIHFHNPIVREDADIYKLAQQVSREQERIFTANARRKGL